ncbi:hypothetical protein LEMLEM_LOCUS8889, partial [Lemmus lemmus]
EGRANSHLHHFYRGCRAGRALSLPRGHQALSNALWLQLHFSPDRQWGSLMGLPRGGRESLLERLGTFFSEPEGTALFIPRSFYLQRTPGHPGCPKKSSTALKKMRNVATTAAEDKNASLN